MGRKKKDPNKKGFLQGFKEFISKGSVIDLAIAVIIGGAFGAIVSSFVNDIVMPPIAALLGETAFDELVWVLRWATVDGVEVPAVVMHYGRFIQTIINFLIIAFVIYVVFIVIIKGAQKRVEARRAAGEPEVEPEPEPEPVIPEDIQLLTEIRDQLRDLNKGK